MRALALFLVIFGWTVPVQASFVFTIGSVTGAAGTTFVVPVTVTTPDGMQFGASGGFNLGIDPVPSGTGLTSGIALNATPVSGSTLFASPGLNTAFNGVFNIDGIVNSNASTGALLTNNVPSTVFNLRFDVGAGVAPGTYAINFASNALTSVTDTTGTALTLGAANGYSLNSGAIIIAVPEPTSLALTGLVVVVAAAYAGRRRLRKTKEIAA